MVLDKLLLNYLRGILDIPGRVAHIEAASSAITASVQLLITNVERINPNMLGGADRKGRALAERNEPSIE